LILAIGYRILSQQDSAYQQINASWSIQGFCYNGKDRSPVAGAEVTAHFWEAITAKHTLGKAPLASINIAQRTDEHGRFRIVGRGGHVQLSISAPAYRPLEPWEEWRASAVHGVSRVETNLSLPLHPLN